MRSRMATPVTVVVLASLGLRAHGGETLVRVFGGK